MVPRYYHLLFFDNIKLFREVNSDILSRNLVRLMNFKRKKLTSLSIRTTSYLEGSLIDFSVELAVHMGLSANQLEKSQVCGKNCFLMLLLFLFMNFNN